MIKHRTLHFLWIILSITASAWADNSHWECNESNIQHKQNLQAQYQVDSNKQSFALKYWRSEGLAAYQYPQAGVTELWQKEPKGQVSLTKAFERYQRAVSYEPADLKLIGKGADSWQQKKHLLSPSVLSNGKMKPLKSENGCRLEQYTGTIGKDEVVLVWAPQLELVIDAKIKNTGQHKTMHYKLANLQTYPETAGFFKKTLRMDAMDFADIGDNEADPFISKMINLGFVEHTESNVLNEKGESVSVGHSHNH